MLPEALQQASTAALASLWNQAPALANESLRSAQASWDAERGELDAIRQELAGLCDAQSQELEQIKAAAATAEQTHQQAAQQATEALAALRAELAGQAARANQAGALRQERDAAQLDATQARERAAELAGELAQADTQNAELLVRLAAPKAKR